MIFNSDFSLGCILGPRKDLVLKKVKKTPQKGMHWRMSLQHQVNTYLLLKNSSNLLKWNTVFKSLCLVFSNGIVNFKLQVNLNEHVCVWKDSGCTWKRLLFLNTYPITLFFSLVHLKVCLSWVSQCLCEELLFWSLVLSPRMKESIQGSSLSCEFIRLLWPG